MMYKLLGFLLLLVTYNAAHPGERAEVLCSIKLNEMLTLLCEPYGFNTKIAKRSSLDLLDYVDNQSDDSNDVINYPLANSMLKSIYRENAINSLTQTRRRQRGIVDECCKQSCTTSELMTYCKGNKKDNGLNNL